MHHVRVTQKLLRHIQVEFQLKLTPIMIFHFLFFPLSVLLLWLSTSGAANKDTACSAVRSSPFGASILQPPPRASDSEWGGPPRAGNRPSDPVWRTASFLGRPLLIYRGTDGIECVATDGRQLSGAETSDRSKSNSLQRGGINFIIKSRFHSGCYCLKRRNRLCDHRNGCESGSGSTFQTAHLMIHPLPEFSFHLLVRSEWCVDIPWKDPAKRTVRVLRILRIRHHKINKI